VADALTRAAHDLPGPLALGLVMAIAMLLTPLLHHAAAVLVLGPVAAWWPPTWATAPSRY
jgi:hypothetical protein